MMSEMFGMKKKDNPWNEVLIRYSRTGALPPCPFCSRESLAVEKNISCAHIGIYVYCSSCGKWTHADGHV